MGAPGTASTTSTTTPAGDGNTNTTATTTGGKLRSSTSQYDHDGHTTAGHGTTTATTTHYHQQHQSQKQLEKTYTSLIQQYLQVMCVDNATFLAERMVATFPSSNHARYLLGVCHYRAREPRRALSVLETITMTEEDDNENIMMDNHDTSADPLGLLSLSSSAASYLMAKCCVDLQEYKRAEEVLLDSARKMYKTYKLSILAAAENQQQQNQNGGGGGNVDIPTTTLLTMDEWLVETSPCPIPNGAAGLYLLGTICRASTRKKRAMDYFQMSLQLDPLMWVSYEALCEMGANDIDPTSIFGVRPKEIDVLQENLLLRNQQAAHGRTFNTNEGGMPLREKSVLTPHHFSPPAGGAMVGGPPVYPALFATKYQQQQQQQQHDGRGPMDLSTPANASSSSSSVGGPNASLFQTAPKQPPTMTMMHPGGTTPHPQTGERIIRPNQLQFDTPNLTPIPMQQDASFVHHYQQQQHGHPFQPGAISTTMNDDSHNDGGGGDGRETIESSSSYPLDFVDTFNPNTVRRAKHVAARLYYQPSPETPDVTHHHHTNNGSIPTGAPSSARRYLRGRSALLWSNTTTTTTTDRTITISETPLRRGGGGRPSDISTTRRPRTLFQSEHKAMRENTNDLNQNIVGDGHVVGGGTSSSSSSVVVISAAAAGAGVGTASSGDEENRHLLPPEEDGDDTDQPGLGTSSSDDVMLDDEDPEPENNNSHQQRSRRHSSDHKLSTNSGRAVARDETPLAMEEDEILERHDCVQEILELFCVLGAAYWRLCQYRCSDAIEALRVLPQAQHKTGWVLHQEGRAYFEMADYENAKRSLQLMERQEPYRMKGLELLSTVLWQLKKEIELAHLAQRVVDFDRLSPEAWCVVGNCFSLQKEHETALVFFGRSLQLDPSFTYTHTLSGYEYMANEDFDKAMACFRNAILSDERHYNAWYGMGAIYHRQEKYDLAEYHFLRAVKINPQSSVLRCNLGMSQYSNGKSLQALDTLAEAFRLDPQNPQARFQRATIYVALNRPEEAVEELEKVRDAAPREATVHFAMGKVLKKLGKPQEAMRCFLTALDLDPKDNQLIKSAMDKLDEPDIDEEVTAF